MQLFHASASPFVRKVMVLLHELDKTDAVELCTVATTALAPDGALAAANPLARIPALVRADAGVLYDSRVITAYLDALFDGGMYPTGAARWDALTLEATGDGMMDSGVSMVYERRLRPEDKQFEDLVEAHWGKISAALGVLEARWMGHLAGPVGMGHVSVACALGYLDFRHANRDWQARFPTLAGWYDGFAQRPSMQATAPQ